MTSEINIKQTLGCSITMCFIGYKLLNQVPLETEVFLSPPADTCKMINQTRSDKYIDEIHFR